MSDAPLWTPSPERVRTTRLTAFEARVQAKTGVAPGSYAALHDWSIRHAPQFWAEIWDFCGVIGERGERLARDLDKMPGAQFLPDARLNFTENLLRP